MEAEVAVIGGGVVGLAVAAKLSEGTEGVFLLERRERFGLETSTHNSGVIHSGIHYPPGSLKARLCVRGNALIYQICERYRISHRRTGKLTVAVGEEEMGELERLRRQGEENGVEGLRILEGREVRELEPRLRVEGALYSPSTGIVEPDELMGYFRARASERGAVLMAGTEVTGLRRLEGGYEVRGISWGERFLLRARSVVNCAGLEADRVASLLGMRVEELGYRLHYCKGDYFRFDRPPVRMPVYPVPRGEGLGIHLTPDLGGAVRAGPNAYYVDRPSCTVESDEREFREALGRFLPSVSEYRLIPEFAGVRPKLQGPGEGFRDFVIRHEEDRGLPGFINLIGIESPGLTASPAIAELVAEIYDREVRG